MTDQRQTSLPWSEEQQPRYFNGLQQGYDGELTQMSFKHVVGSNVFKNTENQFDKEWEWFTNQQNGKINV